ncbi:MAG: M28 family metallopeptidase [bacterium]
MKWVLIPVLLVCASCGQKEVPLPVAPAPRYQVSDFKGLPALNEVERFLGLGSSRVAGTPGAQKAADYLVERLQAMGVYTTLDAFQDPSPDGTNTFRNVMGVIPGKQDGIVILAAHYDLKSGIDSFVGANDSGSGVGLLLALAPILKAGSSEGSSIWLVFFDGEECRVNYGVNDGLHGSRHLAKKLAADGRSGKVQAFMLMDMIGDKNLTVTIPRNGDSTLISAVFKAAAEAGKRAAFSLADYSILDDHQPFIDKGIPAVDFIDFEYGSAPRMNDYWHTAADTLDKLSADSLETVGQVVLLVLNGLASSTGK